ncbi:MAG TPA: tRNA preQ1(34) S-adenosylmethionine ribosyltransferase-isomerase QueA [Anaerolineales bacterium]|nr:tRNA preQ1(34) S-adenosylmethionine ribosyltransferase-isomerase QueA [Anaerolineales bacterium]
MKTSDFDYNLPEASIAQTPVEPRDSSRLIVLHRDTGEIEHRIFRDVGDYLHTGDLLVLNQTRVIPARIYARKETGGRIEILLLRRRDELTWEALVGGKGLRVGKLMFVESDDSSGEGSTSGDIGVQAEIIEILDGSERLIKFSESIEPYFSRVGNVPLPPYIHEKLNDPERYQTVYAREPGSAAAPTAGLHFTPRLLERLQAKGIKIAYVTLHVGLDTFAPVTEDNPEEHIIHTEWCELPEQTADLINQTKQAGGRVIAVGTTSVRTLESAVAENRNSGIGSPNALLPNNESRISPFIGPTSLYILPGYQFRVVDAMITNFHLPKSTLLMLVSAFAGREKILETYEIAIREGYRFYSFGDAMLIL